MSVEGPGWGVHGGQGLTAARVLVGRVRVPRAKDKWPQALHRPAPCRGLWGIPPRHWHGAKPLGGENKEEDVPQAAFEAGVA